MKKTILSILVGLVVMLTFQSMARGADCSKDGSQCNGKAVFGEKEDSRDLCTYMKQDYVRKSGHTWLTADHNKCYDRFHKGDYYGVCNWLRGYRHATKKRRIIFKNACMEWLRNNNVGPCEIVTGPTQFTQKCMVVNEDKMVSDFEDNYQVQCNLQNIISEANDGQHYCGVDRASIQFQPRANMLYDDAEDIISTITNVSGDDLHVYGDKTKGITLDGAPLHWKSRGGTGNCLGDPEGDGVCTDSGDFPTSIVPNGYYARFYVNSANILANSHKNTLIQLDIALNGNASIATESSDGVNLVHLHQSIVRKAQPSPFDNNYSPAFDIEDANELTLGATMPVFIFADKPKTMLLGMRSNSVSAASSFKISAKTHGLLDQFNELSSEKAITESETNIAKWIEVYFHRTAFYKPENIEYLFRGDWTTVNTVPDEGRLERFVCMRPAENGYIQFVASDETLIARNSLVNNTEVGTLTGGNRFHKLRSDDEVSNLEFNKKDDESGDPEYNFECSGEECIPYIIDSDVEHPDCEYFFDSRGKKSLMLNFVFAVIPFEPFTRAECNEDTEEYNEDDNTCIEKCFDPETRNDDGDCEDQRTCEQKGMEDHPDGNGCIAICGEGEQPIGPTCQLIPADDDTITCTANQEAIDGACYNLCADDHYRSGTICLPNSTNDDDQDTAEEEAACIDAGGTWDGIENDCLMPNTDNNENMYSSDNTSDEGGACSLGYGAPTHIWVMLLPLVAIIRRRFKLPL